jgi:hypothetical protein
VINYVNGVFFRDVPDREMAGAVANQVAAEIVNRLPYGRTLIAATTGMAFRTDYMLNLEQTGRLMRRHWNHVHVTIGPE